MSKTVVELFKNDLSLHSCGGLSIDKYARVVSKENLAAQEAAIKQALVMDSDDILTDTLVMLAKRHGSPNQVGVMECQMKQNDRLTGTRNRLRIKLQQKQGAKTL
jgi:hypothetical protein